MRFLRIAATAAIAAGLALGMPSAAQAADNVNVRGSSFVSEGGRDFTFHAVKTPSGQVNGVARLTYPDGFRATVRITCANVSKDGDTVIFGGIARSTDPEYDGEAVFFSAQDDPDLVSYLYAWDDDETTDSGDPQACENTPFEGEESLPPVLPGEVTIK